MLVIYWFENHSLFSFKSNIEEMIYVAINNFYVNKLWISLK